MIRTFIGIELDEETRAALAEQTAYLRHAAPNVRWVPPENLHLTLKFIGNIPEPDLPELLSAVTDAVAEESFFSLGVRGLGCFPDVHRPRTVWAGVAQGCDDATRLAKIVETACAEIGYPPEKRPYHPHITLGRVKHPRGGQALPPLIEDGAADEYGIVDVESVTVFMSELKKKGAEYTPMHHAPLAV